MECDSPVTVKGVAGDESVEVNVSQVAQSVLENWREYESIEAPPSDAGAVNRTTDEVSVVVSVVGAAGREGLNIVGLRSKVPVKHPCAQYCQATDWEARMLSCRFPAYTKNREQLFLEYSAIGWCKV